MKNNNKIEFLYKDDDILVLTKPSGLLTIPDRYNRELPNINDILKKLKSASLQRMWRGFFCEHIHQHAQYAICSAVLYKQHMWAGTLHVKYSRIIMMWA